MTAHQDNPAMPSAKLTRAHPGHFADFARGSFAIDVDARPRRSPARSVISIANILSNTMLRNATLD